MFKTNNTENDMRLGPKLKVISNTFRRIADERTHELDITGMQSFLLGYLARNVKDPPCQRDIEVRFNIKHPTATGLLDRLSEKGYVDFAPDRYDKRKKRIAITEKGLKAAESTKARLDELDGRLTYNFTPEELTELHRLVDKMVANARTELRGPKEDSQ